MGNAAPGAACCASDGKDVGATRLDGRLYCAAMPALAHKEAEVVTPYDYNLSTEENYGIPHFTGTNQDIRPLLDYTWHRKYRPERVEVQDRLIDEMCSGCAERQGDMLPWVIFTAGAMGAGKGFVMRWMADQGHLPLEFFVLVDPDQIRQKLPEWNGYVRRDPETAGDMTQKEAGCIAEIVGYRALRQRQNVIFDGSLRDADWYIQYFQKLRHQYPGIRIMILHILADYETVITRAHERALKTGRTVPKDMIDRSLAEVPRSVRQLAPYADFVCRVVNKSGLPPQLAREEGAPYPPPTVDLSWDLVRKLWVSVDKDGDGELTREEVQEAIRQGLLTEAVLQSMDRDGDGSISRQEFLRAEELARVAGTRSWK